MDAERKRRALEVLRNLKDQDDPAVKEAIAEQSTKVSDAEFMDKMDDEANRKRAILNMIKSRNRFPASE
jgi:hypothetical protein